ncbi:MULTISPECIES: glycosyltransferase family 8 protein [Caproicibacterium]|uniref:Glycosyltransferase family 8 protein n=1 Tax=Caproicibacterium argilliputei TaxID=3030016 RepID=A0AA97H1I8_9FIRM|nr:glycosyltransferase family 8 protein [Caproicibacterium argilliputei]WOC32581.1 glycosyltransferase family 8 protein [Caproicibacterium argilliputei]
MNLLYGTNAGYCEQTAVSMRSVFENNRDLEIQVFLLCEQVPAELRRKMCSVADDFDNVQVTCLNPQPFLEPLEKAFQMRNWRGSSVQYIYACICDAFPRLDRILWLDGDVVCCGSLRELWETDMGDTCVAAGLDCTPFLALQVDKPFYNTPFYFNAGVLLFDLNNCYRHELQQRCRNVLRGFGKKLAYCDQSMLNLALPPRLVHRLDLRWNYPAGVSRAAMQCVSLRDTPEKRTFSAVQLNDALSDLRLIHYIGGSLPTKPWFAEYRSPLRVDYIKYRAHTPWREEPLRTWPRKDWKEAFVTDFSKTWDTPGMGALVSLYQKLHGWGSSVQNLPEK